MDQREVEDSFVRHLTELGTEGLKTLISRCSTLNTEIELINRRKDGLRRIFEVMASNRPDVETFLEGLTSQISFSRKQLQYVKTFQLRLTADVFKMKQVYCYFFNRCVPKSQCIDQRASVECQSDVFQRCEVG